MTNTKKRVLVTAAIAGLVAGAVAETNMSNHVQRQSVAGKPVLTDNTATNGCNGCSGSGHTNSTSTNSVSAN